jgi:signal transduction histidine kinase
VGNENRINELITLKEIAETLNGSYDTNEMLQAVLVNLIEVTGLSSGWIFIVDEQPEYVCVADHQLPPGLMRENKSPMNTDLCWCLNKYWDQELKQAVNIMSCKRLSDAVKYKWGDTQGITHHATVPLKAGGELFGILNVGSPGKEKFSREELALLEAVAFQVGTAVNRSRLYHAQQKRAINFSKLGEVSQHLGTITKFTDIPREAVEQIGKAYDWPIVAILTHEESSIQLRAIYQDGKVDDSLSLHSFGCEDEIIEHIIKHKRNNESLEDHTEDTEVGISHSESTVSLPMIFQQKSYGVLYISSPKRNTFDQQDIEVIRALAETISLTMENARLYEQRRELTRYEERNRLSRDLHDSVCQTLFSLSLTAKGAESIISSKTNLMENHHTIASALLEIQNLSQDALKEMRSLIWQLRPTGLEKGLVTALKEYGKGLSIEVNSKVNGVFEIPTNIEEGLYRIGQEILNNISKHSGTSTAFVQLQIIDRVVMARFRDEGKGFTTSISKEKSMGLLSIRERVEILGGSVTIVSEVGRGTEIMARLPIYIMPQMEKGRE